MMRMALCAVLAAFVIASMPPTPTHAAPTAATPTPSPTATPVQPRSATPSLPTTYGLTCTVNPAVGPTPAAITVYPVPGTGAPDATDETGQAFGYSGNSSCGWVSRPYRSGEQKRLCFKNPLTLYGGDAPHTYLFSVYNDFKSCMVVTGFGSAPTVAPYPSTYVVCHAPLGQGAAPAGSFYTAVLGLASTTTQPQTLPTGYCTPLSANPLTTGEFCVANDQDAPYVNQLLDLQHSGFFRFLVHMDPGCNIYERGTLSYLGETYPLDEHPVRRPITTPTTTPGPVPLATATP